MCLCSEGPKDAAWRYSFLNIVWFTTCLLFVSSLLYVGLSFWIVGCFDYCHQCTIEPLISTTIELVSVLITRRTSATRRATAGHSVEFGNCGVASIFFQHCEH